MPQKKPTTRGGKAVCDERAVVANNACLLKVLQDLKAQGTDPTGVDLAAWIKGTLETAQKNLGQKVAEAKREVKEHQRLRKRFRKKDGESALAALVEGHCRDAERNLAKLEEEMTAVKKALQEVSATSYEIDPNAVPLPRSADLRSFQYYYKAQTST